MRDLCVEALLGGADTRETSGWCVISELIRHICPHIWRVHLLLHRHSTVHHRCYLTYQRPLHGGPSLPPLAPWTFTDRCTPQKYPENQAKFVPPVPPAWPPTFTHCLLAQCHRACAHTLTHHRLLQPLNFPEKLLLRNSSAPPLSSLGNHPLPQRHH